MNNGRCKKCNILLRIKCDNKKQFNYICINCRKKNIYIHQLHTKIIKNVGIGMVINMLTFLNFSL